MKEMQGIIQIEEVGEYTTIDEQKEITVSFNELKEGIKASAKLECVKDIVKNMNKYEIKEALCAILGLEDKNE